MPRYNKPGKTWEYTNEFDAKAIQLTLLEGVQIKQIAKILDIHTFTMSQGF
jgi:transposase